MNAEMTTPRALKDLKLFRKGKVRDVYDLGDKLLIIASDRISAFDHILPTPIPDKGRILTVISAFWFKETAGIVPNHLISTDLAEIRSLIPSLTLGPEAEGRTMLVRKVERFDAECVARGYLAGSGWKEYLKTGAVCGHKLPAGIRQSEKLAEPIFTPATKNDKGHDENISRETLAGMVGRETAQKLEELTLALYTHASVLLEKRGLILSDTKFEFGRLKDGKIILIDEILTPDSSRFWDATLYQPGGPPPSFDKQFVRDYLEKISWDKNPPVPALPPEVVEVAVGRYREALRKITQ